MSVSAADILAAIDVLKAAQEETADIEFELAVSLRAACHELKRVTGDTISILESEMLRQVEAGEKRVDGVIFCAVNDNKDTWDHDAIESAVVAAARAAAINLETGVIDPAEAARQAAHLYRQVYVSPSTGAKIGGLQRVGLDPKKVRQRVRKGRKLDEIDTQS